MRIIIVRARTLVIAALLMLVIPAVIIVPRAIKGMEGADAEEVSSIKTDEQVIALTYNCTGTDEWIDDILDALSEYGSAAAFFVTSEWAHEHSETLGRISDAGHIIGGLSDGSEADIREIDAAVSDICGAAPLYYRVTGKDTAGLRAMGKLQIGASIDAGDDKKGQSEEAVLSRLVSTGAGDIILMRSSSELSARLLPKILRGLKKTYKFVSIEELISKNFT